MSVDETLQVLVKKVDRIERLLDHKRPTKTWVKVSVITQLTGWNRERMRKARDNGLVTWKKDKDGFFYLLESLPEIFLKPKQ